MVRVVEGYQIFIENIAVSKLKNVVLDDETIEYS